jgi:hypothetical protein
VSVVREDPAARRHDQRISNVAIRLLFENAVHCPRIWLAPPLVMTIALPPIVVASKRQLAPGLRRFPHPFPAVMSCPR